MCQDSGERSRVLLLKQANLTTNLYPPPNLCKTSLKLWQSKGNKSSITDYIGSNIKCITTPGSYIISISFMKFHPLVTKLLLGTEEKSFECRQSKGNYSFITNYTDETSRA